MDMGDLSREPRLRQGIVFLIDRDHHVAKAGQSLLQRVEEQPVLFRGSLVKMKAVGNVNHPRAGSAALPGGQARQHAANRRIADDKIIARLLQKRFELPVGRQVSGIKGRPMKRDLNMTVCVFQLQAVFDRKVVMRRHVDLIPLLLQHLQIGQMKLADMAEHRGNI